MWRWTLTLLLVATLGVASTGCPQEEPAVPPPDPAPPTEPASPPDQEYPEEPASPPDQEYPEEPASPPQEPGSP